MDGIQERTQTGPAWRAYTAPRPSGLARLKQPVSGPKAWTAIICTAITAVASVASVTPSAPPVDRSRDSVVQSLAARSHSADVERAALTTRVSVLERKVDNIDLKLDASIYIGCELLRRSEPAALPPTECRDLGRRRGP